MFRLKDDLSPVEEVVGEVMPKSDDSDDDNIAPVEVAGVVLPKRTPWLVLGPDNDDENDDEDNMNDAEWWWWWLWCLTDIFLPDEAGPPTKNSFSGQLEAISWNSMITSLLFA